VHVKEKAPRLIQGAQPEFVCLLGPWFAALQKKLKRDWNINNFITYTSGISNLKMGNKLVNFNGQLAEDDVSTWDASVCEQLCKFEANMTKNWFHAPVAVWQLVEANIFTHGKTMTGIKYRMPGTRKSGDPYTSLYNSVLNALMHVWAIARHNGWSYQQCEASIVMFVQGDDNAMSVKGLMPDMEQVMLSLGFNSKFMLRRSYQQLEFCSMRIYQVKEGFTFGPKPGRIFAKTGYYINPPANVSRASLVKGTMMGLMSSCYHIPPVLAWINRSIKLCGDAKPYYERFQDWKTRGVSCTTCPATWDDLAQSYSWNKVLQNYLEKHLESISDLEAGFDFLCVQLLCDRDTGGNQRFF
jgi:hypothetical protein